MAMASPGDNEDPGWGYVLRGAWLILVPFPARLLLGRRLGRRAHGHPSVLESIRLLFVNFVGALAMVGMVVGVLTQSSTVSRNRTIDAVPAAVVLALIGVASAAAPPRIEHDLDCSSAGRLLASYRIRFFLRVAFAEAPALFGFVGFIGTGRWWMYPLGLVFAAVGLLRLAPTATNLGKDQRALDLAGCRRSLLRVLTIAPPGRDEGDPGLGPR
ncbi:MAG: hypothetical protein ACYDH6_24485 [Acidimicrobiales bacterium]